MGVGDCVLVWVRVVRLVSIVMLDVGFVIMEGVGDDLVLKSEGYILLGVDRRELFGEFLNLIVGDGVCVWVWVVD